MIPERGTQTAKRELEKIAEYRERTRKRASERARERVRDLSRDITGCSSICASTTVPVVSFLSGKAVKRRTVSGGIPLATATSSS